MSRLSPRMIVVAALLGWVFHRPVYSRAADWPQWRGPNRDNVSSEKGLLQEWPADGPPHLWTATGMGEGIASVSIAEGKIFTFGYQADSEFVVALDEKTGELSWATRVGPAVAENSLMRWLSQRAPSVDGSRLYLVTAGGELVCLTTTSGREQWRKNYTTDFRAKRPLFGFCDFPLVDGDRLICSPGGLEAKIVALDKQTGEVIWKTVVPEAEQEGAGYSALVVVEAGGLRQYVTSLARGLIGVAADDGRFLWRYDGLSEPIISSRSTLVRGDQIFYSNGRLGRLALLKVDRDGDNAAVHEIYKQNLRLDPFQDCTTLVGEHLYAGTHQGFPVCLNWKTGENTWKPQRIAMGKLSLVAADGCLYFRHSDGRMTLAEASPEQFVPRGTFVIPDPKPSIGATSPVIAGKRLYLRDNNRLLCYDIRADAPERPATPPNSFDCVLDVSGENARHALRIGRPLRGSPPRWSAPQGCIRPHAARCCKKDFGACRSEKGRRRLRSGLGRRPNRDRRGERLWLQSGRLRDRRRAGDAFAREGQEGRSRQLRHDRDGRRLYRRHDACRYVVTALS